MIFDGRNGGTVELLENVLVIRRKGVTSFLTQGLKGEKRIPYSSIRSVQFKEAGFTTGYIQFGIAGGVESGRGVWDATTDENTVLFTKDAAPDFHRLRDMVEDRAATVRRGGESQSAPNLNIGDELTRLADLRDRGVLTDEEFSEQKTRLLRSGPPRESEGALRPTAETHDDRTTRDLKHQLGAKQSDQIARKPKKVGKILGFGCLGVIGILFVLGLIGSKLEVQNNVSGGSNDDQNVSIIGSQSAEDALKVTAVQLSRAYDANEARAQAAYGNQLLLVTGTVAGVDLDVTDDPVLKLATDNQFMPASAYLREEDKPRAGDLNKGQKVTLLCQSVSEVISMPQLKDCVIK